MIPVLSDSGAIEAIKPEDLPDRFEVLVDDLNRFLPEGKVLEGKILCLEQYLAKHGFCMHEGYDFPRMQRSYLFRRA